MDVCRELGIGFVPYSPLGRGFLKWEMHTEFVTYTIFADGSAEIEDDVLHR